VIDSDTMLLGSQAWHGHCACLRRTWL